MPRYVFTKTKSDKHTAWTKKATVYIRLPFRLSYLELLDTLIHEDFHVALWSEGMTTRQDHYAIELCDLNYFTGDSNVRPK